MFGSCRTPSQSRTRPTWPRSPAQPSHPRSSSVSPTSSRMCSTAPVAFPLVVWWIMWGTNRWGVSHWWLIATVGVSLALVGCGGGDLEVRGDPSTDAASSEWVDRPLFELGPRPALAGLGEYVLVANSGLPGERHGTDFALWRTDQRWAEAADLPVEFAEVALGGTAAGVVAAVAACEQPCERGRIEFWTLSVADGDWVRSGNGGSFEGEPPSVRAVAQSPDWAVFVADGVYYALDGEDAVRQIPGWAPEEAPPYDGVTITTCVIGDELIGVSVGSLLQPNPASATPLPVPQTAPLDYRVTDLSQDEVSVTVEHPQGNVQIPGLMSGGCTADAMIFLGDGSETRVFPARDGSRGLEFSSSTASAGATSPALVHGAAGVSLGVRDLVQAPDGTATYVIDQATDEVLMSSSQGSWSATSVEARELVATESAVVARTPEGLRTL